MNLLIIEKSPLFQGIKPDQRASLLTCLSPVEKIYQKGEFLLHRGAQVTQMGLVISGTVHIIKEDFWGNRMIMGEVTPPGLFAETYACMEGMLSEVSVIATETTVVLFLDLKRLLTTCAATCDFHGRLIHNLLSILAEKNLMLTRKIEHMAKKTTREKLLSYLSSEALKHQSSTFQIPFQRQQLAEYLAVERSAMSTELSKLQKEGYLTTTKTIFHLNQTFPKA